MYCIVRRGYTTLREYLFHVNSRFNLQLFKLFISMSGARPISSLDLSPGIRTKLTKAGFQTVRDLEETTPVDLSKGL